MKMYRSLTELIGHTPLLALTGYCRENGLNATIAAKLEAFPFLQIQRTPAR